MSRSYVVRTYDRKIKSIVGVTDRLLYQENFFRTKAEMFKYWKSVQESPGLKEYYMIENQRK